MNIDPISAPVRSLITDHIRSVVQLECLLLLQRDPMRSYDAEQVGRELRIDAQFALRELSDLAERGFVAVKGEAVRQYHYAPASDPLDAAVRQLAEDYAQRRVSVIELIYAKPSDVLQSFADAFRLRKERGDG